MYSDPFIVLFIAGCAGILALSLLVMALFYIKAIEKLRHSEHANAKLRNELGQKPVRLLQDAHEKALQIIDDANKKAEDILADTKAFENASKQTLESKLGSFEQTQHEDLKKATLDIHSSYQTALGKIKENNINILNNITKDIENDVVEEFSDFRHTLEKQTIDSEKQMKEKLDKEYSEVQKEIETYKQTQLQKVDEQIYTLLFRVSELAFGKNMTVEGQEKMILEALDEAKKENQIQNP